MKQTKEESAQSIQSYFEKQTDKINNELLYYMVMDKAEQMVKSMSYKELVRFAFNEIYMKLILCDNIEEIEEKEYIIKHGL